MITKEFGKDFNSHGGALTLGPREVSDSPYTAKSGTKTHLSGWTISGEIHESYYYWVNYFEASHPYYGLVKGDFESKVYATSEEGFQHFYKNHEPEAWNYQEI